MESPNVKGFEFEGEIRTLLIGLRDKHPDLVTLIEKPTLQLQNGEIVIPDFQLIVKYSAETRHYLIECQDRTHYSHSILHKIQHIRTKQALKTFFFVYRDNISPELERAMDKEGVVHRTLAEFGEFLRQISEQLNNQPERPKDYRPPVYAGVDGQHISTALGHALRRLGDAQRADSRCTSIAAGLYFVEDYQDHGEGKAINTIKFLRDLDRERLNPFASYYIGWFDYSFFGSVKLDDEPEFLDRVYGAELTLFRRNFFPFQPTGYDCILFDVTQSPVVGPFRFSTALHLDLSNLARSGFRLEELLMQIMERPGRESSMGGAWALERGLLAGAESVTEQFARYLELQRTPHTTFKRVPGAKDYLDFVPGDYGKIEV